MNVQIGRLKSNPKNPRVLRDEKFAKLKQSITDFPDMLNKRPIIAVTDTDGKFMVLGGNMRLRACQELKMKEVPVILADEWTEEQRREFIIKDNVGFGEWDWAALANDWDGEQLAEWGLDMPIVDEGDAVDVYTKEVKSPTYQPGNVKPSAAELVNSATANELIAKIKAANITKEERGFLLKAAARHRVFNYQKIADFYAHSPAPVQRLMEDSALVIIDFNRAIELGYVRLSEEVAEQYGKDYPNEG